MILLWILQVCLGIVFIAHGFVFLAPPSNINEMITKGPLSRNQRWFIGIAEILGGIGLILPQIFLVYTWLIPIATIGLALIMISATIFHIIRKEQKEMLVTFTLFLLLVIVLYVQGSIYV